MRKMADSGKCSWRVSLSSTAESWSRPNGFSMISRAPRSSPTPAMPPATVANIDGGMAKWKMGFVAPLVAARRASNVAGSL